MPFPRAVGADVRCFRIHTEGFDMTFHRTLPALLLGLLLAGCSTSTNPVATNDTGGTSSAAQYAGTAGVTSEAAAISEEFDVSAYEDGAEAKAELDASFSLTPGLPVPDTAIDPALWFRTIRTHDRRYVVEFDHPDTNTVVAHVRIVDRLKGSFNVVTKRDTIDGNVTERRIISKPLADTSVRKAVFRRHRIVRDGDDAAADREDAEDGYRDGWSRWKLVAISGHEVTSDDGTRTIQSVRIQAGDVDVTVTNPLELLRVRSELIHVPPGTPVHVTAQTGDPTDVVVLYTRWGRQRMRPAEGGGFEGRFPAPLELGLRHFAVNAIAHGTIYDDVAPYDSKAWGIPFIVGPAETTVASN
jgi:hypothetical protein